MVSEPPGLWAPTVVFTGNRAGTPNQAHTATQTTSLSVPPIHHPRVAAGEEVRAPITAQLQNYYNDTVRIRGRLRGCRTMIRLIV